MDLELKKLNVEYKRVNAAREEMEYKILEHQAQIKHLEKNIGIQIEKEEEIQAKIKEHKNKPAA